MYSLLIVDDEPLVLVGLQSMLTWEELGIHLIGTARTGMQALELIQTGGVDIVLTDIRMPTMDGLELMARCRALPGEGPEFIILTSYEDFSYAREALKYHAADYLVKLELTPKLLKDAVERVCKRLEARKKPQDSDLDREGAAVFTDRIFLRLLNRGYTTEEECEQDLSEVGLNFHFDRYIVAVCKLSFPLGMQEEDERVRGYFYSLNIIKEMVKREFLLHALALDTTSFCILGASSGKPTGPLSLDQRMATILKSGAEMVFRYFGNRLRASVGTPYDTMLRLCDSYSEALKTLDVTTEDSAVLCFQEVDLKSQRDAPVDFTNLKTELAQAIRLFNTERTDDILHESIQALDRRGVYYSQGLDLCSTILYVLLTELEDGEAVLDSFFPDRDDGYRCLYGGSGIMDTLGWLKKVRTGLAEHLSARNRSYLDITAESIRSYIGNHYKEKLSLQQIADRFALSANYTGTLFKKCMGINISDYIAQVRITAAEELLQTGRYRIYEVAETVGFENQYYFNRVFKKLTGKNPKEYLPQGTDRSDR